jgi:Tol biopolymer transport system component
MTADRDLTPQLDAWLDDRATSTVPDGLLARSLARVDTTPQRPGWLAAERRTTALRPASVAFVPAWAIVLIAILAAIALVAVGSQVLFQPRPAIIAEASVPPSADASVAPEPTREMTADPGPLGGRLILAEVFRGREVEGPHDVVAIDARTGSQTLLGTLLDGGAEPVFSGAHPVTFQRTPSDMYVLVVGGDAPHVTQLTDAGRAFNFIVEGDLALNLPGSPSTDGGILSPSGTRVAYIRTDTASAPVGVVVLERAGGASRNVAIRGTDPDARFGLLSWTPDESALLADGCRPCNRAETPQEKQTSHHSHLYVLPLDGSPAREFGDVNNGSIVGSWTPDSRSVVTRTSVCAEGSHMPRCDPAEDTNVFGILRVSDGVSTVVPADPADGTGFFEYKVSPDATHVVYRTNNGLFVRDLNGSPAVRVGDVGDFWADWSPDGQWVLFERGTGYTSPTELWIVSASGKTPRLLGNDLAGASW